MVIMTKNNKSAGKPTRKTARSALSSGRGPWMLKDAKAHLSEVVRAADSSGPQELTIHGRVKAVVLSAQDYNRLKGQRRGADLVETLRNSPLRGLDLDFEGTRGPVRKVKL